MTIQDEFLRKAAVLIATLDDQTAETLLAQLGRDQALLLTRMLGELAPVTVDDRSQILQEFLQANSNERPSIEQLDAVEVDDSLAAKIAAADSLVPNDDSSSETPSDQPEDSPFSFLADTSPEILAGLLEREHPQTISVVLSYLPPTLGSEILRRLPADRQSDVLQRLGQLNEIDKSLIAEIERELERLFQRRIRMRHNPPVGLATIRAILDTADDTERQRLLGQLQQRVPRVLQDIDGGSPGRLTARESAEAETPAGLDRSPSPAEHALPNDQAAREVRIDRPCMKSAATGGSAHQTSLVFDFNDLNELDDNALALVFCRANPDVALVALTGASRNLLDRIQRQLSWREARELKKQIERLGPIRLTDVERAQQRLTETAATLIQQGMIPPPPNRRFITAA